MATVPIQTKPKRVNNVRAQLLSMRNIGPSSHEYLQTLQKSLQKHNQMDDPETSDPDLKDDEDKVITGHRLWDYFIEHTRHLNQKVEQEKVNGWLKLLKNILKEADKKIDSNRHRIDQLDSMIRSKYRQTHNLFKQIESIKIQKEQQKKSRRKREKLQSGHTEKIKIIHQNIDSLNNQIQEQDVHKKQIIHETKKLEQERRTLLFNLLKNGYYMHNGASWILQRMVQYGQRPTKNDFPKFLDQRSQIFLMRIYDQLKGNKNVNVSPRQEQPKTMRSKTTSQISLLANKNQFKEIYNGTKSYLIELVKKKQWQKSSVKLPKIGQTQRDNFQQNWKQMEKKRIVFTYSDEKQRLLAKKIQFGIKLDTILS